MKQTIAKFFLYFMALVLLIGGTGFIDQALMCEVDCGADWLAVLANVVGMACTILVGMSIDKFID